MSFGGDGSRSGQIVHVYFYSTATQARRTFVDWRGNGPPSANARVKNNVFLLGAVIADLKLKRPVLGRYWKIVEGCLRSS